TKLPGAGCHSADDVRSVPAGDCVCSVGTPGGMTAGRSGTSTNRARGSDDGARGARPPALLVADVCTLEAHRRAGGGARGTRLRTDVDRDVRGGKRGPVGSATAAGRPGPGDPTGVFQPQSRLALGGADGLAG